MMEWLQFLRKFYLFFLFGVFFVGELSVVRADCAQIFTLAQSQRGYVPFLSQRVLSQIGARRRTQRDAIAYHQRRRLEEKLSKKTVNNLEFEESVKQRDRSNQREEEKKDRTTEEALQARALIRVPDLKLRLINGGVARVRDPVSGSDVTLDLRSSFFAMKAPLTQGQWVHVMGENPSWFVSARTQAIGPDGKTRSIRISPNHPVENITFWSALKFANRLSELHGLEPVYDLSEVVFVGHTRAENGTLRAKSGELKINGPSIYETKGFRLMTEAEYFLLHVNSVPNLRSDLQKMIQSHIVHRKNSNAKTKRVGHMKPVEIFGNSFDDLYGNVSTWLWDIYWGLSIVGGIDPVAEAKEEVGTAHLVTGIDWRSRSVTPGAAERRKFLDPNIQSNHVGVRFVRGMP